MTRRVGSKADDPKKDQSRRSRSKVDDPWVKADDPSESRRSFVKTDDRADDLIVTIFEFTSKHSEMNYRESHIRVSHLVIGLHT